MTGFEIRERVAVLQTNDDGSVERREGVVYAMADNSYLVRCDGLGMLRFMYSAPDDMWLRVVPDGEAVECTRLVRMVEPVSVPSVNRDTIHLFVPADDPQLKRLNDWVDAHPELL